MLVEYVDHMGSDISVVNAAKVSFHKMSDNMLPDDKEKKLIKYLADHGHWSPFAHTSISLRWKAPIFVARQLVKHQVGLTWNEVSRRYVKEEPELWWPKKWRKAAANVKQGSSDELYQYDDNLSSAKWHAATLVECYNDLLLDGLCPEQARMFLPQNMITEWIWTGSVYAFARVYNQRTDPHAQKETRDLVKRLDGIMEEVYPISWAVLTNKEFQ